MVKNPKEELSKVKKNLRKKIKKKEKIDEKNPKEGR